VVAVPEARVPAVAPAVTVAARDAPLGSKYAASLGTIRVPGEASA